MCLISYNVCRSILKLGILYVEYLQHPSVGTNSYGRHAFSYTAPTVWNKLPYKIRNAPSVTLFRKKLKTLYFKTSSRPPDGSALSGPEV